METLKCDHELSFFDKTRKTSHLFDKKCLIAGIKKSLPNINRALSSSELELIDKNYYKRYKMIYKHYQNKWRI